MEHIADIELIEHVAGNLTESRTVEVREHIAACPQCLQRIEQMQKLSDMLGLWEFETAGHDVAERVAALAEETEQDQPSATREHLMKFMPQVLRIAASIIIAVGLGHKLGEYSVEGSKPPTTSSPKKPEYLAALGLEWSSGLAKLVLEDHSADTGGEQ